MRSLARQGWVLLVILVCEGALTGSALSAQTDEHGSVAAPELSLSGAAHPHASSRDLNSLALIGRSLDISLPADVAPPLMRTQVWLGAHRMEVLTFKTRLKEEELARFFEQALPRDGWLIEKLPWQARSGMLIREQILATKDQERVVVQMMAQGDRTLGFLNHWRADAVLPPGPNGKRPLNPADEWLLRQNVLTGDVAVPEEALALSPEIPRYPGARAVSQSRSDDDKDVTQLFTSSDSPDAVAAFFRAKMRSYGWTVKQRNEPGASNEADRHFLVYENTSSGTEAVVSIQGSSDQPINTPKPPTSIVISILQTPFLRVSEQSAGVW